uniref:Uncharacterized protein n=1 Tax=viral metagenome TaxID=1070528 RepID=A0A6M3JPG1_9ZZZZ
MNTDTGEVKRVPKDEKLKPPWVEIKEPNPHCPRCKGLGSVLGGNRKQRRHNLIPMHYIPCPDCSGRVNK